MSRQWLHTEPDPRDESQRYPLAPWVVHPSTDLPRDLLAELLSDLRDNVNGWTEIANESTDKRHAYSYAAARLEGAQNALKLAERLARRANYRAQLRAERTAR